MLVWETGIVVHTCNPSTKLKQEITNSRRNWKGRTVGFLWRCFYLVRNVVGHKPLSKLQCIFKMCTFELKSWLSEWEHLCTAWETVPIPNIPGTVIFVPVGPIVWQAKDCWSLLATSLAEGLVRDAVSVECVGRGRAGRPMSPRLCAHDICFPSSHKDVLEF